MSPGSKHSDNFDMLLVAVQRRKSMPQGVHDSVSRQESSSLFQHGPL